MKNTSFKTSVAIITFVIGVVLVTFWVKSEPQQLTVSNTVIVTEESEKYAVYSIVLNELFIRNGYKSLIIFDKTSSGSSLERLKPNFNLPVNYILTDEEEFKNRVFGDEKDSKQKNKKQMYPILLTNNRSLLLTSVFQKLYSTKKKQVLKLK
jgi:hypothetical protein